MDTTACHGSFNGYKPYINGNMEEERASIRWMNEYIALVYTWYVEMYGVGQKCIQRERVRIITR